MSLYCFFTNGLIFNGCKGTGFPRYRLSIYATIDTILQELLEKSGKPISRYVFKMKSAFLGFLVELRFRSVLTTFDLHKSGFPKMAKSFQSNRSQSLRHFVNLIRAQVERGVVVKVKI
jgi:hypothetical protein